MHSFSVVAREKRSAMSYAVLAGVSFGVASLAWKGFVVGPSILFLAYFAQVALNMFRRKGLNNLECTIPCYAILKPTNVSTILRTSTTSTSS